MGKKLIAIVGASSILAAGVVTSIIGHANRLESSLKNQPQSVYQNVSYSNNQNNRSVIRYADSRSQPIGELVDLRSNEQTSRVPIRPVQEVLPAPTPEAYNAQQFAQAPQTPQYAPMPTPSTIRSDLPQQNQFIGYSQETVPIITQHWHQGYGIIPRPVGTFFRWLFGVRPIIPEWRRVPTAPVLHSQIQYQTQLRPMYTSTPVQAVPQYTMPAPIPRACDQIRTVPAPPVPSIR